MTPAAQDQKQAMNKPDIDPLEICIRDPESVDFTKLTTKYKSFPIAFQKYLC